MGSFFIWDRGLAELNPGKGLDLAAHTLDRGSVWSIIVYTFSIYNRRQLAKITEELPFFHHDP